MVVWSFVGFPFLCDPSLGVNWVYNLNSLRLNFFLPNNKTSFIYFLLLKVVSLSYILFFIRDILTFYGCDWHSSVT